MFYNSVANHSYKNEKQIKSIPGLLIIIIKIYIHNANHFKRTH